MSGIDAIGKRPPAKDWPPSAEYPAAVTNDGAITTELWFPDFPSASGLRDGTTIQITPGGDPMEEGAAFLRGRLRKLFCAGEIMPYPSFVGASYLKDRVVAMVSTEGWNTIEEDDIE